MKRIKWEEESRRGNGVNFKITSFRWLSFFSVMRIFYDRTVLMDGIVFLK